MILSFNTFASATKNYSFRQEIVRTGVCFAGRLHQLGGRFVRPRSLGRPIPASALARDVRRMTSLK